MKKLLSKLPILLAASLMLLACESKDDEPIQEEVRYGDKYPCYFYLVKSDDADREVIYNTPICGVIILPSEGGVFNFSKSPNAIFHKGDFKPTPLFDLAVACCFEVPNENANIPRPVTFDLSTFDHLAPFGKLSNLTERDPSTQRIESPFAIYIPDAENNSFKIILNPNTLQKEREFVFMFLECTFGSNLTIIQEAAE